MDLQLGAKRALVTGSTAGIGFAMASGLAAEGATVVVNGRTRERVERAVNEIRKNHAGANVQGVEADVSSAAGCDALTTRAGEIDILINNAGIFEPKPFGEISDADWERFFQANVMSGVRLSRFYFPKMLARNWGRIVFISSESGLQIPKEMIHYGMTKTAQLAVARGLAEMSAGSGVTVNSVLPGPTASEGAEQFVSRLAKEQKVTPKEFEKKFFESARPSSLLQRFATPEEVANLVVFVSSPLSSATNGASLRVDGGVVRSIG
jgi:NAD(P)-dependent dehydrogenase (short-subunit alcohol dehydrogenase family)